MRVLIVLDHRNLLDYGSTIAIAEALDTDAGLEVHVASVGFGPNVQFFVAPDIGTLHTRVVDKDFSYDNMQAVREWVAGSRPTDLDSFAGILMRFDPLEGAPSRYAVQDDPYVSGVMRAMTRLEGRFPIINRPGGILACADKTWLARFPEFVPGVKVCMSVADIHQHLEEFPSIVLKTRYGTGGVGIVRVERGGWLRHRRGRVFEGNSECPFGPYDERFGPFIERAVGFPCLAVEYQPRVRTHGDKRVAVFEGNALGAILRLPRGRNWIANKAQGGRIVRAAPDEDEIAMIETLDPILRQQGIVFYGIDTLVDRRGRRVLSEINVTSPNGLLQIRNVSRANVLVDLSNRMADYFAR